MSRLKGVRAAVSAIALIAGLVGGAALVSAQTGMSGMGMGGMGMGGMGMGGMH